MKKIAFAALLSSAALSVLPGAASAATPLTVTYDGTVTVLLDRSANVYTSPVVFTGETTLEDANDGSFAFSSFTALFNNVDTYTYSNVTASFNALNQLDLFTNGTRFTSFQFTGATNFAADGTAYPVILLPGDMFNVIPDVEGVTILGGTGVVSGVAAVPEPATWAMMLLGFGAVGYSMRSRKTSYRLAQAV